MKEMNKNIKKQNYMIDIVKTRDAYREQWMNEHHAKSIMKKTCNSHSFCRHDFEWEDPSMKIKSLITPLI